LTQIKQVISETFFSANPKKLNLTQQKQKFIQNTKIGYYTPTTHHKTQKPGLVASYDRWPGKGQIPLRYPARELVRKLVCDLLASC